MQLHSHDSHFHPSSSSSFPPPRTHTHRDQTVFGGQGLSVTGLQLQTRDSLAKVREAVDFLIRGVRLLGSDVSNSGRLFTRAALGEDEGGVGMKGV